MCILQTGLSGNLMMLSILYYGGLMMQDAQITVGELSSFMLYAITVGFSVGGTIVCVSMYLCNQLMPSL